MKKFYSKELGSVENAELFWNQISEGVRKINGRPPTITPFFSFGKIDKKKFKSVRLSFYAKNEKDIAAIDSINFIEPLTEQKISEIAK